MKTRLLFLSLSFLFFLNVNSQIIVTAPNGGQTLNPFSTYTITWMAGTSGSVAGTVSIDYSIDNGISWISIASGVSMAAKAYVWTVPNNPSAQCLIKVYNSNLNDVSNAVFTITGAGSSIVESTHNNSIKFSPNPAYDYISITNNLGDISSIKVFNSVGSLVADYAFNKQANPSVIIPVNAMSKGAYYFRVSGEGGTIMKKIIIVH